MKRVSLMILFLALVVALSPPASATLQSLSEGNSTVEVSTQTQSGMFNWTVDGQDILYQQWFWYRIGDTGGESSIDALPLISESVLGGSVLNLQYGALNDFTIDVQYTLNGGTAGSHTADIGELIRINNFRTTALPIHFFQYSDFDLNQVNRQDIVRIDSSQMFVDQWPVPPSTGFVMSETIATPRPNHVEANTYANTLNSLNDANPTTLNGNLAVLTPSDVTWAFQWDFNIGAGGSKLISKDKRLDPVPEPAAIGLLGGALLALASKFRKRFV